MHNKEKFISETCVLYMMGRHAGPERKKILKIKRILKKNPQGLWVREIARKTKLDKTTVSRYLNTYMRLDIRQTSAFPYDLVKMVKLKRKKKKPTYRKRKVKKKK